MLDPIDFGRLYSQNLSGAGAAPGGELAASCPHSPATRPPRRGSATKASCASLSSSVRRGGSGVGRMPCPRRERGEQRPASRHWRQIRGALDGRRPARHRPKPAAGSRAARCACRARKDRRRSACTAHRGCTARRVPPPRQRQRVDHAVPAQQRPRQPLQLGIEEGEIEGCVVHHQHGAFDEPEQVVGALVEARLGREELDAEAVYLIGRCGMSRSGLRWQCHTRPVGMQLRSSTQPTSTMRWPELDRALSFRCRGRSLATSSHPDEGHCRA